MSLLCGNRRKAGDDGYNKADQRNSILCSGGNQGPITEEDLQVVPARVEEIPEDERGEATVNLVKVDGVPLGLTVSGGADKDGRPRVSNLRSTGIAARSDQLQVGDIITSVNGIRSTKLKHGEIISLLKNISEKVCLEIEYLLPPTTVQTSTIIQKTTEVFLQKEHGSFGFVLRGGNHGQHCRSRPLVVTHIRPDSPAAREGTLKTGDRIISIGSTPLIGATLQEVINEIQSCGEEATLTIEYDVSVMEAVTNASGPLLIEVSKVPGAELGITMAKSTYRKKPVICIDRVKPASISDRCGALHIGDHILSIDNISMATSSVREASDLLQSSSDQVKLEILPVSHLAIAATPFSQNRFTPLISSAQSLSALNTHRFRQPHGGTLTSYGRRAAE
ncbi:glutamate receptor-interacting protein 1-like isoform X2 [Ciona intestinalis]